MASPSGPVAYTHVPPPWTLHGDVYALVFWTPRSVAERLPEHTFSPLEGRSDFAAPPGSRPGPGLGMIQLVRYRDSPVGPYDELIFTPCPWSWQREGDDGRRVHGTSQRITRIYVSQPYTCYNGRRNWGVPKHLARFDWTDNPDGSTSVKVFPHDTTPDATEASPSTTPLLQATFKPVPYLPRFPFSTGWLDYIGISTKVVMPPLPAGSGSLGELPSSDKWVSIAPLESSSKTSVGWFDLAQGDHPPAPDCPNFWPGLGRWQLGIKMEDAVIEFGDPLAVWDTPKSSL
ncbi:hypothetical protein B0I35DRAFT_475791 [Stachybotrys elegans]|uniref:Acetoacetate decarboxylase n=1 Tax=Stachybotrys elegans TaxID=80388 RepID=A0A8K0SY05_9HYPO|nr:hypothetical protein B0I35DRAFT_475791 [Stachybotrys elegans]